jgi:hypothetical protein
MDTIEKLENKKYGNRSSEKKLQSIEEVVKQNSGFKNTRLMWENP